MDITAPEVTEGLSEVQDLSIIGPEYPYVHRRPAALQLSQEQTVEPYIGLLYRFRKNRFIRNSRHRVIRMNKFMDEEGGGKGRERRERREEEKKRRREEGKKRRREEGKKKNVDTRVSVISDQ